MYDHIRIELLFLLLRTNIWWDTVCKAAASKKWYTSLQMSQRISPQPLWWTNSQPTVLQVYLEHPYPYHTITQLLSSILWDKHKRVLVKVQRRAAQYHTSRKTIPWETLEQRCMKARLVMGTQCKMLYSRWSVPNKHTCNQRPRHKAHTDICKKNYYQGTFFSSLIPLLNQWPETVASATSLEDFRMDGWTVF